MSFTNQLRKALLFNERYNELKKRIPMGCFDGVEVCDLVGTYILNKLNNFFFKATHLVYVEMTG